MDNRLYMTVGLPRSGKSTWARSTKLPIVSPDAIRATFYKEPFNSAYEPHVWQHAHIMVKALFNAGHDTVILDACNTTEKRRNKWLDPEYAIDLIYFSTPEDVCLERAVRTGRSYLVEVIIRMAKEIEVPSREEVRQWH